MELATMARKKLCLFLLKSVLFLKGFQAVSEDHSENTQVRKRRSDREIKMGSELVVKVSWNSTQLLSSGDELLYNVTIHHSSSSTGDAHSVLLKWFFPSYVTFLGINQTAGAEITTRGHSSVIDFEVARLPRHGNISLSLTFIFDPSASLQPGRHFVVAHARLSWNDKTTFPVIENSSSKAFYSCHLDAISIEVEVPGCSNELGIGNGHVKDYQLTSSSYIPGYEPFKARMDGSAGWCAAILDQNQFLQVEFIRQVRITKISVRGKDVTSGIEQFFLEHSVDDQKWDNYTEYGTLKVFQSSLIKDVISTHWILNPFDAYNIRIRPTTWNNSMCLTVELCGCENKQSAASCNFPLGMESGFITDDALSTSQQTHNAEDSRLNKMVKGALAGWLANPFVAEDYLQIDLGVLYQVAKFGVQGQWSSSRESKHFVKKYNVMFSNDSFVWSNYTEDGQNRVFDGPSNSDMAIYPTFAKLTQPVVARFVRIFPQPQNGLRVMRLEIYGCLKEPMPFYTVPEDFSRRSYLLNNKTGHFYVCLYTNDRTESSCMYTWDGHSWKSLNPRVVNVLAAETTQETIYALDRSNNYLRSSDLGRSWIAISATQWKKVKSLSYLTLARKIPDNLLAKDHMNANIQTSDHGFQWAVSNVGVHMKQPGQDWVVVATWKCCFL